MSRPVAAPAERAGSAAALSETGAELGGALGIAVLGSIGAAVYRGQVADALPAGAAEAARDTLGGAVVAAGQLPGALGMALLDAARQAFTQGLVTTSAVSAVLTLGLAALAAVLLGRR